MNLLNVSQFDTALTERLRELLRPVLAEAVRNADEPAVELAAWLHQAYDALADVEPVTPAEHALWALVDGLRSALEETQYRIQPATAVILAEAIDNLIQAIR